MGTLGSTKLGLGWTMHGDGKRIGPGSVVSPQERLSWPRTIGIGAQHVVAMFGATFVFPIVMGLDPNLAITRLESMPEVAARSLSLQRFLMILFLLFAIVGVTLAVVGVYGVLAQVTKRRTREMGIRIALGAPVQQVRWMVVKHGLRLTLIGLAIGAASALMVTRAMSGLLFAIPVTDPVTFGGVGILVAIAGALASLIPAIHASRADPAVALRGE